MEVFQQQRGAQAENEEYSDHNEKPVCPELAFELLAE
jgi:hypothetical protein